MHVSSTTPGRADSPFARPALLFDLIGTLLDEQSDYEALDQVMESARRRFRLVDDAGSLSGDFSLAMMEILRGEEAEGPQADEPATFLPFEEAAKAVFQATLGVRGVVLTTEDVAWFWQTYLDIQKQVFRAHPDAVAALRAARERGHPVFVVTDADPYLMTTIVPQTKLAGLIDGFVTASDAGYAKPHQAIYRLALERSGTLPVNAVAIGDSYERDILGARAAGIRGILLDRHAARTVHDVPVIHSLDELPLALTHLVPGLS